MAKTKACPADVPCMYELKHDARHATKGPMMMCGSKKIPGVAMDKTVCHASKDGSHIRCYCMTDNCNQNCTLPKELGSICIGSTCIGVNTEKCTDLGSTCTGSICIGINSDWVSCDGGKCMARTSDDQNNPMTMKTMKTMITDNKDKTMTMLTTKPDDKDKTKTLKSTTTTKDTGVDNDTPTSKNMLTSKSSTTIATAFHVVIGMIIIIKHFALLMKMHLITTPIVWKNLQHPK